MGYSATDHNVIYLDLVSGIFKQSHHAQFDKEWYLQPLRPPAAQLLHDLGVEPDTAVYSQEVLVTKDSVKLEYQLLGKIDTIQVPWPPSAAPSPVKVILEVPLSCTIHLLPLRHIPADDLKPQPIAATATQTIMDKGSCRISHRPPVCNILLDSDVDHGNMAMIYMSPDPYFDTCEQPLDLRKFDLGKHATVGLNLYQSGGRVHIASMSCSTPAVKISKWRACIRGAWLIKIDDTVISTIIEAE